MECIDEADVVIRLGTGATVVEVPGHCDGPGLWWNSLELPAWQLRMAYAPPSAYMPGATLLAAVTDVGALPVRLVVQGSSQADLQARKNSLSRVLGRWPSRVAVHSLVEGEAPVVLGDWESFPTVPQWGPVRPAELGMLVAQTSVSIPVNPSPGAP